MTLSHDSYNFETPKHQTLMVEGPELQYELFEIFGVKGVSQIVGKTGSRMLTCEVYLDGYSTLPLLRTAVKTIQNKAGQLTGTLTETVEGNATTYGNCTFLGFKPASKPMKDGSGVNGWFINGTLHWLQRKVDS